MLRRALSSPGTHDNVFVPIHDVSEVLQVPHLDASYAIGSYRLPIVSNLTNHPKVPDQNRFPSPKKLFRGKRPLMRVNPLVRNGLGGSSGRSAVNMVCLRVDLFRPLGPMGSDHQDRFWLGGAV